jgi:AcrR family transcriptional regulator
MVERWTPQRRRELTRTALLDAAAEVFARRGFDAATLEEVAETAGYTRGAIYRNFSGKEELFFAVFERFNETVLEGFASLLSAGTDLDLSSLVERWSSTRDRQTHLYILDLEFRLSALRNPQLKRRFARHRRRTIEMISELISKFASESGLSLPIPAPVLADVILSASDGLLQADQLHDVEMDRFGTFVEILAPVFGITDSGKPKPRRRRTPQPKSKG